MKSTSTTGLTNANRPLQEGEDTNWTNPRATQVAQRAAKARQGSGRRRLIDPATCERDYSQAEVEFMQAMQAYKTTSGAHPIRPGGKCSRWSIAWDIRNLDRKSRPPSRLSDWLKGMGGFKASRFDAVIATSPPKRSRPLESFPGVFYNENF